MSFEEDSLFFHYVKKKINILEYNTMGKTITSIAQMTLRSVSMTRGNNMKSSQNDIKVA